MSYLYEHKVPVDGGWLVISVDIGIPFLGRMEVDSCSRWQHVEGR